MNLKPNHICKNINCRKEYYACDYCGKTQNWRSMACSIECYNEYIRQVELSRKNNSPVDIYPERTDMTHSEVVEMVDHTPIELVKEKTMIELSDYADDIQAIGLSKTIDDINKKKQKEEIEPRNFMG